MAVAMVLGKYGSVHVISLMTLRWAFDKGAQWTVLNALCAPTKFGRRQ